MGRDSFSRRSASLWNISIENVAQRRISYRGGDMKRAMTAFAAAAMIAAIAVPASADARRSGKGPAIAGNPAGKPYGYYSGYMYGPPPARQVIGVDPIFWDDSLPPQPWEGCYRYRYGYRYHVC
jgi:PAB1-binding protein PBP1